MKENYVVKNVSFDAVSDSIDNAKGSCIAFIKQYIGEKIDTFPIYSIIDETLVPYTILEITENNVKMQEVESGTIYEERYSDLTIVELFSIAHGLNFGF